MSAIAKNDATNALLAQSRVDGFKIMSIGNVKVQMISNIEDFKTKFINFASLKPAILIN